MRRWIQVRWLTHSTGTIETFAVCAEGVPNEFGLSLWVHPRLEREVPADKPPIMHRRPSVGYVVTEASTGFVVSGPAVATPALAVEQCLERWGRDPARCRDILAQAVKTYGQCALPSVKRSTPQIKRLDTEVSK